MHPNLKSRLKTHLLSQGALTNTSLRNVVFEFPDGHLLVSMVADSFDNERMGMPRVEAFPVDENFLWIILQDIVGVVCTITEGHTSS